MSFGAGSDVLASLVVAPDALEQPCRLVRGSPVTVGPLCNGEALRDQLVRQQRLHFLARQRPSQVITLDQVAAHTPETL